MTQARRLIPWLFCLAGLFTGHGPVLLSRFAKIQNDLGDSRFVNFLLEHSYLWALRRPHHASFWDPEYFFPAKNVGAYAESLLGSAPLYWVWRLFGAAPDTSFQLWLLAVSAANFWAAYWLLHRRLSFKPLSAAAGAFLFAFAASRINQTMHHQLFPHFFTVTAVAGLHAALTGEEVRRVRRGVWLLCLSVTGQIYASVYLGWFLLFGLLLALPWALAFRDVRGRVVTLLRKEPATWAAAALVSGALLSWMMVHYMAATRETGLAAYSEVAGMLPRPASWIHTGASNWLYGWTASWPQLSNLSMEHEQRIGIGWVSLAAALVGLFWARRGMRLSVWAFVFGAAALLCMQYGDRSPWQGVFLAVPGAQGIRAACRIGVALLFPLGYGLARSLEMLSQRGLGKLAWPLAILCALEQGETTATYDKAANRADIAKVAELLDPARCDAFYYSPLQGELPFWKYQLDAVWASVETLVPTVNGYSRTAPPGWNLNEPNVDYEGDQENLGRSLNAWELQRGLVPERVCWVRRRVLDGPNQADFIAMNVPDRVVAEQPFDVSLTFKNIGEAGWTRANQYRLGAQAPQDTEIFGMKRVELPRDVPPGDTVEIRFTGRAPKAPGRYAFRYRMVRETIMWFGQYSPPHWIEVAAPDQSK